MKSTRDIRIGEDEWIHWVDFPTTESTSFSIDSWLEHNWIFWKLLETECVSGCCGIDAFSFLAEDIQKASKGIDKADLLKNLESLKTEIEKCNNQIIISSKLNNLFDKSVFIRLLEHIIRNI